MKSALFLLCGLAALLILGCGSDGSTAPAPKSHAGTSPPPGSDWRATWAAQEGPRHLFISLDNWEGPENVGVLMAAARGYFKQEGVEVTITRGEKPRNPLQYVKTGPIEIGVAHEPQLVMAQEEGLPIVAIDSLLPRSTAALIWLKGSGINDVADLEGKTIATPGIPYQASFLEAALASQGVSPEDVTIRGVGHELVPALLHGRADAIFGGSWNLEGAALRARGLEPVVTPIRDLGIPNYDEAVLIARSDRLSKSPDLFRGFIAAVARGTRLAIAHPREAAEVILRAPERNREVGRRATAAQLRATLPLLSTSGGMNEERAAGLVEWMEDEGIIE